MFTQTRIVNVVATANLRQRIGPRKVAQLRYVLLNSAFDGGTIEGILDELMLKLRQSAAHISLASRLLVFDTNYEVVGLHPY